jgi:hypothetical protein
LRHAVARLPRLPDARGQDAPELVRRRCAPVTSARAAETTQAALPKGGRPGDRVELRGLEPLTPILPGRRVLRRHGSSKSVAAAQRRMRTSANSSGRSSLATTLAPRRASAVVRREQRCRREQLDADACPGDRLWRPGPSRRPRARSSSRVSGFEDRANAPETFEDDALPRGPPGLSANPRRVPF